MMLAAPSADPAAVCHVIVLGTPSATSFTHAIAETYRDAVRACGQHATIRDLYAMRFDPLLRASERSSKAGHAVLPYIAAEIALLEDAAVLTLVYPLWVGMPPAIIKGYMDRVLGAGFRDPDRLSGTQDSLLRGKRLLGFSTSASTRPWLEEHGQWTSIRQGIDAYVASVFGLTDGGHVHFDSIVEGVAEHYIEECLADVRETARRTCAAVLSERHARRNEARRALFAQ